MNKLEHTPGPWRADNRGLYIFDKENIMICEIRGWGYLSTTMSEAEAVKKQKANADLIAAAPEMAEGFIEAIKEEIQTLEDCGPCDHSTGICVCGLEAQIGSHKDIIEKATGKKWEELCE